MKRGVRMGLLALLALSLTGSLTALALWCQPNDMSEVLESFRQKPVLYVLNALPVMFLLAGSGFLCRNLFFGAAATNALVGVLSIANRVKIEVRDEPVFPRDLALWKEVGDALGAYHLKLPVVEITLVVGVTLLLLASGVVTMPRRKRKRKQKHYRHFVYAGICFALFYVSLVTVYASDELYNSLEVSSPYRLSVVFNENGFPYNFCHQFTKYQVDRPKGYDRARAKAWDEAAPDTPDTPRPVNVVLVMNEAFSDITDAPAFDFTPDNDPLSNLHAIQSDPHALSLRLVVPGFAGGTANTEFDVFTGMRTNALGAGTTSAMRTVNRNLDSLFRVFAADGYRTMFYHPGNAWFYNRENVYRWFGAGETRFIETMPSPEYRGRWVADNYLAGLIEDAFSDTIQQGLPLFHASTTIQNHMGYPYSKYGDGYEYPPVPLNVEVSPDTREALEVYVEGLRDADKMLGRLRDFLAARTEPVLLVYYGDHLPYLGDDAYSVISDPDNVFYNYETPCVLWANDAAAQLLDWDAAQLPDNGHLSASFLGALILDLTGRGHADAWTAFLNQLRRQVPVVQNQFCMLADGTVTDTDGAFSGDILKWRQWSYYKLTQKDLRGK
ncbi:MAG: LTA synthase family protein [Oscillospiraceae bacterium]|nr:LTA synthase family protein [Oscillospiraceae bacterium]